MENTYPDLQGIKSKIDEILASDNLTREKAEFYKVLKSIISLKIDSEELQYKFGKFEKVFTAMAIGDFSERMDIPNRKSLFSYMGVSVNAVIEELKVNVVKKQYLEELLEYIPHIAIVTDTTGAIMFVNAVASKVLRKPNAELVSLLIANIFKSKNQFGVIDSFPPFEDVKSEINYFDSIQEVSLTVKEVHDRLGQVDGYLYIGKLI